MDVDEQRRIKIIKTMWFNALFGMCESLNMPSKIVYFTQYRHDSGTLLF